MQRKKNGKNVLIKKQWRTLTFCFLFSLSIVRKVRGKCTPQLFELLYFKFLWATEQENVYIYTHTCSFSLTGPFLILSLLAVFFPLNFPGIKHRVINWEKYDLYDKMIWIVSDMNLLWFCHHILYALDFFLSEWVKIVPYYHLIEKLYSFRFQEGIKVA